MQHAQLTPKTSRVHRSMDFILSEALLRRLMAGTRGAEEMRVGFASFIGSTFPAMPRPGVTYYPVLALFHLPPGYLYRTFDQYQLEAGTTALIYPVYRSRKGSIQAAIVERALPAFRAWLEECLGGQKAGSFYAVHDQTFDEVVFGHNDIAGAKTGSRLQLAENSRVIVGLRPGAQGRA